MTSSKTRAVVSALGTAALTLALTLTGCGRTAGPDEASGTEAVGESSSAEGEGSAEIAFPESMAPAATITRTVAQSGDTTGAGQFGSLPESEATARIGIAEHDEIAEAEDAEEKASDGRLWLQGNGMELSIPPTWQAGYTADGSLGFTDEGQTVVGVLYGIEKASGSHYDLEGMARSVPSRLTLQGYTDIHVIGSDNGYSAHGTLCSSYICFTVTIDGVEHVHYVQYVESKSFLDVIEMDGLTDDFANCINEVNSIISSVRLLPDEVI